MSNKKDSLGDRMKENYENRAKTYLVRRMPVIIRLDGKAFHSFIKGFDRPYDEILHNAMNETMKYLCENIQGCKLGYTQSDEITLLITDYDTLTTDGWFDYAVQKICSVSASMTTLKFNEIIEEEFWDNQDNLSNPFHRTKNDEHVADKLHNKRFKAMFDSRCFNIPKEEVTNCFVWRQQDCTRNAIQMLGQCNFSHKELNKKSCNDIQDMLMTQKGINFNDMPTEFKRGVCCRRDENGKWFLDKEIPIFTQDRDYIERTFRVGEENE
jgi:tRNA(His) 5'-end guanylyltransferase